MDFRILGPLEVFADGRALQLGGTKPRALLALLLLHRNEVVSVDRVIDGLWGETPPATAAKSVQVYVSKVRKLVGSQDGASSPLVTRRPGYLLEVAPEELDLDRFERLLADARRAGATGEHAAAAAGLRRALALFRGPPLSDLSFEPFAQAAAMRLEEQRLEALEARVEADLALGRARELVGELGALVRDHPYRERLRASLMLALYRSGRQAEALEAYRVARRALVDELGIDPSPELAELERAMLRHDPAVALPTAAPPPPEARDVPTPLPRGGTASSAPEPTAQIRRGVEAERKLVTVLFCDIVGSAALTERLGAETMHMLLNRFYDVALEELHRYGGRVSRFLGDGFMALVGAPSAREGHARRAVLAALGLQRRLAGGSVTLDGLSVSIETRMGLDTGMVVVGSVGDEQDADLAAIGDTVTVAERLQRLAEPGSILISESTARLVAGYVRVEPVAEVGIEGKSGHVAAHRVMGIGPRRSPLEGLGSRPLSPFVGRERQLAALRESVTRACEGRGQALGMVGEPGMGKSRLILELRRALGGEEVTFLEGRCQPYGSATPYLPVKDHIRAFCGIEDFDVSQAVLESVRLGLAEVGFDPDEGAPLIMRVLGGTEGTGVLADLTPEAIKTRTFDTLVECAIKGSERRPLVLVYEDLHWVDTVTEEFLSVLAASLQRAAILLLCTYRPGYHAPWLRHSWAAQIALSPLTPTECADVAGRVLGDAGSPKLARVVTEKAEGNPFFAEELARAIRDRRGSPGESVVPDTIQDVLMARIDRLADEHRRLLQTASVIGREFSPRLLEPLWGEPFLLEPSLAELTRLEFLYEQAGAEVPTYSFTHALLHDVAYQSLLVNRRRILHHAVGRALEGLYAGRRDEVIDQLAHHYSQTDDSEKAVQYLGRFAELTVRGYAHAEASRALEDALMHAERLPDLSRDRTVIELMMRLVSSLYFQGRFAESLDLLLRYEARVTALDDPRLGGEFAFWMGHTHVHMGDHESAARNATRAAEEGARLGDAVLRGKAHYVLAREGFWVGRYTEGAAHGREAVLALEQTQEWFWLAGAHCWEAINLCSLGRFRLAIEAATRAREIGRERQDPRVESYGAWMCGRTHGIRGDWEPAIADCAEALERSPDPMTSSYAMGWLGFAYRGKGDHDRAIPLLEESVEKLTEFRYRLLAAVCTGFLGGAYRSAGRVGDARKTAEQALRLSEELGYPWSLALARRELGRIDLAAGELAHAARHLSDAFDAFEAMEASFEVAVTHLDLAALACRREQPAVAADHLAICRARFAAHDAPTYLELADRLSSGLDPDMSLGSEGIWP